jgi:hypothetical protein
MLNRDPHPTNADSKHQFFMSKYLCALIQIRAKLLRSDPNSEKAPMGNPCGVPDPDPYDFGLLDPYVFDLLDPHPDL